MASHIREKFPQVRYHPILGAVRGVQPPDFADIMPAILDQPFLREFSDVQVDTLKMMDRLNALGSFDYAGKAVIEVLQPDLVVFSTIPHMVFDYIIYRLCLWSGIRTVMFESTPMRGYVFMMETYDGESKVMALYRHMLQDGVPADIQLGPETKAYLETLRSTYDRVPDYMRRTYNEEAPGRKSNLTLASAIRKLFDFPNYPRYLEKQLGIIRSRLSTPGNYLVQTDKKPEDSEMSRWEYSRFRRRASRYVQRLEGRYAKLSTPVDLGKPFIYVALSFQPERTSSPMAGVYVNQLLLVDLLSKSVPEGWWVYVKEHPSQLIPSWYYRAQCGRSLDYYDDFAALPNVRLVPMSVSSFDLIDHARVVATVTGSVGWEALNRGKPVLLFGHPWYRGCDGTFQISSQQDCAEALRKIKEGYRVDQQKLNLFAHAIEKVGIEGFVERHLRIFDVSDSENAILIGQALRIFGEAVLRGE